MTFATLVLPLVVTAPAATPLPPRAEFDHRVGAIAAWTGFKLLPGGVLSASPLLGLGGALAWDHVATWIDVSTSHLLSVCVGVELYDHAACGFRGLGISWGVEWRGRGIALGGFLSQGAAFEPGVRARWDVAKSATGRLAWSLELTGMVPMGELVGNGLAGVQGGLALATTHRPASSNAPPKVDAMVPRGAHDGDPAVVTP